MHNIGIIGLGFVGSAVYNNLTTSQSVAIYDKFISKYSDPSIILNTSVVFICVPTPQSDEGLDPSAVNENIQYLKDNNYGGVIVLKSTIHPDYLIDLAGINIVANPEFLTEHNANEDFKNQELIILGGRADLCKIVCECYKNYFYIADFEVEICSFREALLFKYFRNIKLAYDILFANFIHTTEGNFRKYSNMFNKLPTREFSTISLSPDGELGFGGSCLPKDTVAYNKVKPNDLTKFIIEFNTNLRHK